MSERVENYIRYNIINIQGQVATGKFLRIFLNETLSATSFNFFYLIVNIYKKQLLEPHFYYQ